MVSSRVLPASLACLSLTWCAHAYSFHNDKQRATDDTAYTEPAGGWRIGLWKTQVGLWDRWTIGTYSLPWLLQTPNLYLKWRCWQQGAFAASMSLGAFATSRQDSAQRSAATLSVVPFEALASYQLGPRWSLTSGFSATSAKATGQFSDNALLGTASAAASNAQWMLGAEYRLTRVSALVAVTRVELVRRFWAKGDGELHPDDYTTVEFHGAMTRKTERGKRSSLVLAWHGSWENLNLRLGLSFGNYDVPGVHYMLDEKRVMPDVDVFYRF